MKRSIAPVSDVLPLFMWPEQSEISAIEEKRRAIRQRMATMRWRSNRRRDLEDELRDITNEQLRLSAKLNGKR
jgi:hypothetical protein